jgi:hypothetical protein
MPATRPEKVAYGGQGAADRRSFLETRHFPTDLRPAFAHAALPARIGMMG